MTETMLHRVKILNFCWRRHGVTQQRVFSKLHLHLASHALIPYNRQVSLISRTKLPLELEVHSRTRYEPFNRARFSKAATAFTPLLPPGAAPATIENYFPDLPPYKPPTTGILSRLPASWVPYAELMRIEKPGGLYGFYFPYLIGIGWAASISDIPLQPSQILYVAGVLLVWTVWHRGAACTINDVLDCKYDRRVARCRLRPVARGAVTPGQAVVWYAMQSLVAGSTVMLLPHAAECFSQAVPIVFLLSVYPLFKRWTDFPQLVLCVPLAWGILMSCSALGVDPWTAQSGISALATACLVASNMTWLVQLDYVNACQDTLDDIKAGVRSMAVRYQNTTAFIATLGTVQVSLMVAAGFLAGLSPIYFVGACGGNALFLTIMARTVDRKRLDLCAWWFLRGSILVGGTTALALLAEYISQYLIAKKPADNKD